MNQKSTLRGFALAAWTKQIEQGDMSMAPEPVVEAILRDRDMTIAAVEFAVRILRSSVANKVVRRNLVRDESIANPGSGAARFIEAVRDYGLSLLDVTFGSKQLGDYLPPEALAYANQQHQAARHMAIQARFVANVARACVDAEKPIREQLTNARAEQIRLLVIESSPAREAAEIALAVA